jgi:glycogen debranching enzyme
VAKGIFDAAERLVGLRLPELFSGLPRVAASFPVPYLGANVPQAWAAGSVFRFIAILCGMHATVDAEGAKLYVNPALPKWMPEITIRSLRLGAGSLDIRFVDGSVAVMTNTSGYRVVHGPAPGPLGSRGAVVAESAHATS